MLQSDLNPDAPEFHPVAETELATTIESGYNDMRDANRVSNTFPTGHSFTMYSKYPHFKIVIGKIRDNVLVQSNRIARAETPELVVASNDDEESNLERVVDVNDRMLDSVDDALEEATGGTRPARVVPAAWNRAPRLATVQVKSGGAALFGAKNIPRPQLAFSEPVDNSPALFVPKLREKPNAVRPLALNPILDENGCTVGYEHPYKTELMLYSPPEWALTQADEGPPPLPLAASPPHTSVATRAALDDLVAHLRLAPEIAIDLEHHSYRTYQGITCLLQLTTDAGGDFIVDALALRDHLHLLNDAFTDPDKIKVFHGAEQDVLWLQRDLGVYVVGMFDTHQAARLLQLPRAGLKDLLKRYCNIDADKTFQLADWRMRPLPDELVGYARGDTHYLLHVWRRMRTELRALGPDELRLAFCQSQTICAMRYVKPVTHSESHSAVYQRSGKRFNNAQLGALRAAWAWRDAAARELDESPGYLLPNHMLVAVAEALPRDVQGLRALCDPPPPFLLNRGDELHRIILACRELPEEPAAPREAQGAGGAGGAGAELGAPVPRPHKPVDDSFVPEEDWCEWKEGTPVLPADLDAFRSNAMNEAVDAPQPPAEPVSPPPPAETVSPPPLLAPQKSQLNAEAAMFVPPHCRYQGFRDVSQEEELKAQIERAARVAALARGIIQRVVLRQMQGAPAAAPELAAAPVPAPAPEPAPAPVPAPSPAPRPARQRSPEVVIVFKTPSPPISRSPRGRHANCAQSQRKRKMDKRAHGRPASAPPAPPAPPAPSAPPAPERTFKYKSKHYSKLYSTKGHKQPKMK